MDAAQIKTALIDVLQHIQTTSDLECPPLVGGLKPVEALPKFDSKIWPVAVGMLSTKLGITIESDVNIFRQKDSTIALTIDQIVAKVSKIADKDAAIKSKQVSSR